MKKLFIIILLLGLVIPAFANGWDAIYYVIENGKVYKLCVEEKIEIKNIQTEISEIKDTIEKYRKDFEEAGYVRIYKEALKQLEAIVEKKD